MSHRTDGNGLFCYTFATYYNISYFQTFSLLNHSKTSLPCTVAEIMLKASNEERGTVAGLTVLSKDLDDVNADGESCFPRV